MPEKESVDYISKFEYLKTINTTLADQVRLADTKASWVFTVLGLLTAILTNILTKFRLGELSQPRIIIFGTIAVLSLILAFKHAAIVMYPRLGKPNKGGMTYFRDIAAVSKEEYLELLNKTKKEEIIKSLQSQAYEIARIVEKKFLSLRIAIISCMFALGWIAVTAIMLAKS